MRPYPCGAVEKPASNFFLPSVHDRSRKSVVVCKLVCAMLHYTQQLLMVVRPGACANTQVPRNMRLVAVPLFELYDNMSRCVGGLFSSQQGAQSSRRCVAGLCGKMTCACPCLATTACLRHHRGIEVRCRTLTYADTGRCLPPCRCFCHGCV
jgi:hypothetical protein